MPFPRVAEIIDTVALFLSQEDDDDHEAVSSSIEDIKNFRLVCREFAATGTRYLIPTISVMRVPQAFEIPSQIAEHSLLRLHVKTLIFYYDKVVIKRSYRGHPSALAITAAQVDHFQASGQDIRNFARLLDEFPRLKQVEIRSLAHDTANGEWHSFVTSTYKKLGFNYTLKSSFETALSILNLLESVETLVLSNSLHVTRIRTSLPCFKSLRSLKVVNPWTGREPPQWTATSLLTVAEELDYAGPRRFRQFFFGSEVIKDLPTSLQTLRLQHIECFDESFPANLNILELSDVLLDLDTFPAALSRVSLSNVRLSGSDMVRWAIVLLSLKVGCKLTISGCFTICYRRENIADWLDNGHAVAYLHCRDTITTCLDADTEVPPLFIGELLMTILQTRSSEESPRAELLRLLFEEHNRHENPEHDDLHRDNGRQILMSMHFETMIQELVEGGWVLSAAPLEQISGRYLCSNEFCNYSYTGIVG